MAIYETSIKPGLTEADLGKLLIINTETGDHELFQDEHEGHMRWLDFSHGDPVHMIRIGHPAVDYLGGRPPEEPKL